MQVPAGFNATIGGVTTPGWPVLPPKQAVGTTWTKATDRVPMSWEHSYSYSSPGTLSSLPYSVEGKARNEADDGSVSTILRQNSITNQYGIFPANLFAMPADNQTTGLFVYVNDLRYAFQLQKLYERDARGGSRYIELIRSHFGISSPDSRLQRPEYLGGNRIPISIHQITNQSQGESDFLGDLGAMSLTTDKHKDLVYSATEHGVILGLCVARYDHSYPQGIERAWRRKTRFDFYWPVFANLSEDYIRRSEIYADGTTDDNNAFGFQERWAEYRYKPNRVAAEMRPGVANTLDSWHFADYYTEAPTISAGWLQEDKTNVDRTLAVTSAVANQIFADIYVKNFTTRPMPLYSIPGLVDHH